MFNHLVRTTFAPLLTAVIVQSTLECNSLCYIHHHTSLSWSLSKISINLKCWTGLLSKLVKLWSCDTKKFRQDPSCELLIVSDLMSFYWIMCTVHYWVSRDLIKTSSKVTFFIFAWLGTRQHQKLNGILMKTSILSDIKKLSPDAQTSSLEGFHSTLNQWHPKMICFSWVGTYCR